ncbi:MAG TPA: hypothetical protein VHZ99_10345 [Steroidobacteraceae bacterium]|jgi:hypothetical protein|nr:hypothetical protein [Steroidobacteraceae bacterium]
MHYLRDLPDDVSHIVRTRFMAEFATVTAAGVPINTPLVVFTSGDQTTIDAGTGLAYPAKAERARRNPKVGLLFEGAPDEPIVSMAGIAAVRDADLQSNLERYLSEQILAPYLNPERVDYTVTREAIWYFTRVLVCVAPAHIRWWKRRADLDRPPQEWHAPDEAAYPTSDPAPPGKPSEGVWTAGPWRELAQNALARQAPAHLTLLDRDGFPIPIRVRTATLNAAGFDLEVPRGAPWSRGVASLSFEGVENFVGNVDVAEGRGAMRVERALPVLPMMADVSEVLRPKEATRSALMSRLDYEVQRRGKQLPVMPAIAPTPTAGARLRAQVAEAYQGLSNM